ncbi:unnamed protein product [Ambrosiozyma monospora]|uniref:Unnamed protein product n=1 Tax=Ambrosiozyma monospora TaxID=43982 RepID=A0ACB5SWX6_AMBMO|nr:unnamed protein product [Ambrosiozyma monospora]
MDNVEQAKTKCPVCSTAGISILEINDSLPADLKSYFKPFPSQLETFFANAQFQYVGMVEKLEFKEQVVNKLNYKIGKLKELLLQAKDEINLMNEIRLENENLRKTNYQLRQQIRKMGSSNRERRPVTIDLTNLSGDSNGSDISHNSLSRHPSSVSSTSSGRDFNNKRQNPKSGDYHSFVAKIQKFSTLKKLPDSQPKSQSQHQHHQQKQKPQTPHLPMNVNDVPEGRHFDPFQAESTAANVNTATNLSSHHRVIPNLHNKSTGSNNYSNGSLGHSIHNIRSNSISNSSRSNGLGDHSGGRVLTPTATSLGLFKSSSSSNHRNRNGIGKPTGGTIHGKYRVPSTINSRISKSPSTGMMMATNTSGRNATATGVGGSRGGGSSRHRLTGFRSISLRPPQITNRNGSMTGIRGLLADSAGVLGSRALSGSRVGKNRASGRQSSYFKG